MSLTETMPAKPKRRRSQKYPGVPTVSVPPDDELGPCMLALTPKRRRFVMELARGPSGYGSAVRAARAAGYSGDDAVVEKVASVNLHNQKVQDALREVGGKLIRASAFAAIRQTELIAKDLAHKDCLKACLALMDRGGFAVETHHTVTVEHKSLDDQALEALRTMRSLNASREQLESMFGAAGLLRYEAMAAEKASPVTAVTPLIEGQTDENEG
jgi:phage terminase small subunit